MICCYTIYLRPYKIKIVQIIKSFADIIIFLTFLLTIVTHFKFTTLLNLIEVNESDIEFIHNIGWI